MKHLVLSLLHRKLLPTTFIEPVWLHLISFFFPKVKVTAKVEVKEYAVDNHLRILSRYKTHRKKLHRPILEGCFLLRG